MKIIHIIPHLWLGGAETMCENICTELFDSGNEIVIISLQSVDSPITKRLKEKGIKLFFLDKKRGLDIKAISEIRRILLEEKPDIIHTHLHAIKYAVFAARGLNIKIIHTVHSVAQQEATGINRILNRFFFKNKKSIPVALSEAIKDTICQVYKLDESEVPVVYNGVPIEKCLPKDTVEIGEKIRIIHVGRFNDVKNHPAILGAYEILIKKHPNLQITLVGDGLKYEETVSLVKENNWVDNIKFCGAVSNVYPLLNQSDIFILPSFYEGIPMTIIEAMGTGLPIVASGVGGIVDMITDGENGLLCSPNAESLAEKIDLFINNYELRKKCSEGAFLTAEKFSSKQMKDKYFIIYKESLN